MIAREPIRKLRGMLIYISYIVSNLIWYVERAVVNPPPTVVNLRCLESENVLTL